jgi:AcrR family transcriptional regulator
VSPSVPPVPDGQETLVSSPSSSPEAPGERERLMDAALYVMRRNGYQGASVQDILDRAGLSTRAFYRQFSSKGDLLLAMFRTASDPDVAQVEQSSEAAAPRDCLVAWVNEMVEMALDPRRVRRLVIFNAVARQADRFEEEEALLRARLIAPLLDALERGATDGSFPTCDPESDAGIIFDLIWSVAHPKRRPQALDRSAACAAVLRFTLPALGSS